MHKKKALLFPLFCLVLMCGLDCGMRKYTQPELKKKAVVSFPKEYIDIIGPLSDALVPIRKRVFFLKHDVDEMKDKLWDGGTNQRIARTDENIDIAKKEISALHAVRRVILNTIYYVYPAYVEPEIVPFLGDNKSYKKITKPIILVSLEDQQQYISAKSNEEKLSRTISYKPLVAAAMKQFAALPDSLKPKIQPLGAPGPVRKIKPYEPPNAKGIGQQ
jgi:hypothetical protein